MITPVEQPSIVYKLQWFEKSPGKAWCLEYMLFNSKEEAEAAERGMIGNPHYRPFKEGDKLDKYWKG